MTKLTDTQAILLTAAAGRTDGMLLPAPETITAPADRVRKAITSLIKQGFAVEIDVVQPVLALRSEGDNHIGAAITDAGRQAVGVTDEGRGNIVLEEPVVAQPKRETKAALVMALLERAEGATLVDLIAATGWLPHTTRAALTGLRKKGHTIEKSKREDTTCYRIVSAA